MVSYQEALPTTLKRYFGFETFRPLQEEIIRDSLAGRDVLVVLPTGGGKSLCYQLPAMLRPGLTVVISPLIALMKDQVDALSAGGIPATFLNSSLAPGEAAPRLRGLHGGEYRLLYVAPERLVLPGFIEDLKRWQVGVFAVDEAHCISEWGHDFRPEYRQLATVREALPDAAFMALTATATARVQGDIIRQLRLRDPARYVASFNRPNLVYRVAAKSGAYGQVLGFLRERPADSGIIYCQARRTADDLAARLRADGIAAGAYHAGLEAAERSRQQEAFLRDEVRVICATIAFGMGINKPNVRFVVHHDLPKNVESYYQETGRAGRDGLPGECLLLFSPGDRVKHVRFIDEKPDAAEREVARTQLEQIVHYAETGGCRRAFLLDYFGEQPADPDGNCGGCDNCLSPRETWDGTVAAQKLLSCVIRIRQQSGFGTGLGHVVDVLRGGETEKIRKWGHHTLSTYGIGHEHSRNEWGAIGRELVRLGLLAQDPDQFNTVDVTPSGRQWLKERGTLTLTRPIAAPERKARPPRAGEIACDEALFGRLRELRKRLADERGVPPYVIFGDVSLRQMARHYPLTPAAFSQISGVGERKLAEFAADFLAAIASHLDEHPRLDFPDAGPMAPPLRQDPSSLAATVRETLELLRTGRDVATVADARGLKESTILGHLESAVQAGERVDVSRLIEDEARREIFAAFETHGSGLLTPVHEALGGRYSFDQLRLARVIHTQSTRGQ